MSAEIVSTCVVVFFVGILLIGFLFGLARGFNKGIIRLFMVVASLVLTFFIVPSISSAVLKINLANYNIVIGGSVVTSFPELIVAILSNLPFVNDITGTDAFATIMNVLPQMILNIVLFVVVFYIIRLVTMIFYWIIAGVCFNKKKMEGKNRHRLLGSLMGVIQNFIIFLVILVPCVGIINMVGDAEKTIESATTTQAVASANIALAADDEYIVEESDNGESTDTTTDDTSTSDQTSSSTPETVSSLVKVTEVVDACQKSWVFKFLSAVKLDKACMYVFDNLSTVKENGVSYTLSTEVKSLSQVYAAYLDVKDAGGFDLTNADSINAIQNLVEKCYDGKFTSMLANDIIKELANKWLNNETFLGLSKPSIANCEEILNGLLNKISMSTDIKTEIIAATNTINILLNKIDAITTNITGGDGVVLDAEVVGDILNQLAQDEAIFDLVKDVVVENLTNVLPDDIKDNDYGKIITETIGAIFGEEANYTAAQAEIPVITQTLDILQDAKNTTAITETKAAALVEALSGSTVIYNLLTGEAGSTLTDTLQGAFTQADITTLQKAVNDAYNQGEGTLTSEQHDALLKLFTSSTADNSDGTSDNDDADDNNSGTNGDNPSGEGVVDQNDSLAD